MRIEICYQKVVENQALGKNKRKQPSVFYDSMSYDYIVTSFNSRFFIFRMVTLQEFQHISFSWRSCLIGVIDPLPLFDGSKPKHLMGPNLVGLLFFGCECITTWSLTVFLPIFCSKSCASWVKQGKSREFFGSLPPVPRWFSAKVEGWDCGPKTLEKGLSLGDTLTPPKFNSSPLKAMVVGRRSAFPVGFG